VQKLVRTSNLSLLKCPRQFIKREPANHTETVYLSAKPELQIQSLTLKKTLRIDGT